MATAELKPVQAASRKIDAKRAAQQALKYLQDVFPSELISDIALEEIEFSEDDNCWLITLSHRSKGGRSPKRNAPSMAELLGPARSTKYKVFKVDAHTGRVVSMKIRKFE